MSAEPLTREDLEKWGVGVPRAVTFTEAVERLIATVRAAEERAERLREAIRLHGTCRCDVELSCGLRVETPCGRCAALAADDAARGEA